MKNEECVAIRGYEGYYAISETGIVTGQERKIRLKSGNLRTVPGRVIKQRVNNYGYVEVRLSREGKTKTHFVHRLLANAFIPNEQQLPQVNHKNGNKQDNAIPNLEWVDASANAKHAYQNGLNKNKGSMHLNAVGVIDNISGKRFDTIKEFCDYYGINYNTGRNALSGCNKHPKTIDLSNIKIERRIKNGNS